MISRCVFTIVFFLQSVTLPFAHADGGTSVRSIAEGIPCLAKYYSDQSQSNRDAQDFLNRKRAECGIDCINADLCPEVETYLNGLTEAGVCPNGQCPGDNVTPSATDDTNRSGIDKDFVDQVDDPYVPMPSPNPAPRPPTPAPASGGLGSFFKNPLVLGLGGLALGYLLFGRNHKKSQAGCYPSPGQFYPPRMVPPGMFPSPYPYGLRPIPGFNYGSLLQGGQGGFGQGGFGQGGFGNQGNIFNGGFNGSWNGSGTTGNIYNGNGGVPPILPYIYN